MLLEFMNEKLLDVLGMNVETWLKFIVWFIRLTVTCQQPEQYVCCFEFGQVFTTLDKTVRK